MPKRYRVLVQTTVYEWRNVEVEVSDEALIEEAVHWELYEKERHTPPADSVDVGDDSVIEWKEIKEGE